MVRPSHWVASGPGKFADSDWCVVADPPADAVAPGGVVLCREGTTDPHPDAVAAAALARKVLEESTSAAG